MALFDPLQSDQLWYVLDILLDRHNPHALVLLAHSVDTFQVPPEMKQQGWELIHRISGQTVDMMTRNKDDTSCFEISVIRRVNPQLWAEL
jgi:hypothetical protein